MAEFQDVGNLATESTYRSALRIELNKVKKAMVPFYYVPAYPLGPVKKPVILIGKVDKSIVASLPDTRVTGKCCRKGTDFLIARKVGTLDNTKLEKITKILQKIDPRIEQVKLATAQDEEEAEEEDFSGDTTNPVLPTETTPPVLSTEATNPVLSTETTTSVLPEEANPPSNADSPKETSAEDEFLLAQIAARKKEIGDISTPGAIGALKKASTYKSFPVMMNALTHALQVVADYEEFVQASGSETTRSDNAWMAAHQKFEKAKLGLVAVQGRLNAAREARDVVEALTMGNALFEAKTEVDKTIDTAWDAMSNAVSVATGAPPIPKPTKEELQQRALEMRARSQAQAVVEGKIDWEFKADPDTLKQLASAFVESKEFNTFRADFAGFLNKYSISADGKLPVTLWKHLLKGMADTGYLAKNVPKIQEGGRESFILAMKGDDGKLIREAMLAKAMGDLKPFVDHAATYLDKVIEKAESGKPWAFWSGTGALDAAKASGGISLEGTVGSIFGTGLNFPNLTVNSTLPLWASLSEMYAKKAAENFSKFKFVGFVGPGASRDQSVFNMIEQPTFVNSIAVNPPTIDWFVVDCLWDADARKWVPTANPPASFSNRTAAIAEITTRYDTV
jgi:hypothetical protein